MVKFVCRLATVAYEDNLTKMSRKIHPKLSVIHRKSAKMQNLQKIRRLVWKIFKIRRLVWKIFKIRRLVWKIFKIRKFAEKSASLATLLSIVVICYHNNYSNDCVFHYFPIERVDASRQSLATYLATDSLWLGRSCKQVFRLADHNADFFFF